MHTVPLQPSLSLFFIDNDGWVEGGGVTKIKDAHDTAAAAAGASPSTIKNRPPGARG